MKRVLVSILLSALMLLGMALPAVADDGIAALQPELTMAVKAAWGLKLRTAAGLQSPTLLVLDCGQQVTVMGDLNAAVVKNGYKWVEVTVTTAEQTLTGFVALKYLTADLTPSCYLVVKGPCHRPGRPPQGPPGPPFGPPGRP